MTFHDFSVGPHQLSDIHPMLGGYYFVTEDGVFWLSIVWSLEPGAGHVSRLLDALPKDRDVLVPCVISPKLVLMLSRRGFVSHSHYIEELGEEDNEAMIRRAHSD